MKEALARKPGRRRLEVRTVEAISGWGGSVMLSRVCCPVRERSSPVEACAGCVHGEVIAQDALSRGELLSCGARPDVSRRAAPALERTVVGSVMRRTAVALRAATRCAAAADALRARGGSAAPVADGRPVGVASEADLLRAAEGARVADAMKRVAPIVHGRSVHRGGRGRRLVAGVPSAADVVAPLAQAPPRTRRRGEPAHYW